MLDRTRIEPPAPSFKVGQQVRCINNADFEKFLTIGQTYTVYHVSVCPEWVSLVGVGQWQCGTWPGWAPERFELVEAAPCG